jgi:hypothetical protein
MCCAAWGGFMRSAQSIAEDGTFKAFSDAAAYDEINDLFKKRTS